ncbi:MAG: ATP phosphoribosyltransferase regulatory subunit [Pontixanthobacter sp.]
MTERIDNLLPEGLADRLPREAAIATQAMRAALDVMHMHGYDRVSPPLIEFEHALAGRLTSSGEGDSARRMFRFLDPVSLRSLAIRSDMTAQIGRIAATSLADHARPLRLCYAGEIALLTADQLDPARQRLQMGAELIGNDSAAAASEIVALAIKALQAAGASGISIDFTLPDLVDVLAKSTLPLSHDDVALVRRELDTKDAGGLKAAGGEAYLPLLFATGSFEDAVAKLASFDGGNALTTRIEGLKAIAARIDGNIRITLDPTERHGFEYQSWFGFTIYADGVRGAAGRGGTYEIAGTQECATGFSLYLDRLADGLEPSQRQQLVYCEQGCDFATAQRLRQDGWRTIDALSPAETSKALGCTHVLTGKTLTPLIG